MPRQGAKQVQNGFALVTWHLLLRVVEVPVSVLLQCLRACACSFTFFVVPRASLHDGITSAKLSLFLTTD